MKKNNKESSIENNKTIHQEFPTPGKKLKQGGANANFPQEYEEERSMDIRMKPQPLVKPKKSGVKR
ncbi:MAG: hypothetical protein ABIU77_06965 [Ferruginibacter sp.]|jgi:hypothetical protein